MEQITPEKAVEALKKLKNGPTPGNRYQHMSDEFEIMEELKRQRQQEIKEIQAANLEAAAAVAKEQASVAKQNRMIRVSSLKGAIPEGVPEGVPVTQLEGVPPETKSRRRSGCGSSMCSARPGKTRRNRKGPRQRRGGYKRRNKTQRRKTKRQTTKRQTTKRRMTKRQTTKRLKTKRRTNRK